MQNTMSNRMSILRKLEPKKKAALIIILLVMLFVIGMLVGIIRSITTGSLWDMNVNIDFKLCFTYGLLRWSGLRFTLLIEFVFMIIVFFLVTKVSVLNTVQATDENDISYMSKGTHGTSRWMSPAEAREKFACVSSSRDITEFIYGRLKDETHDIVAHRPPKNGSGNKNIIVFGSPGTGKSWCFVRTNILQSIKAGYSVVVTDPKGELYTDLALYCRKQGLNVQVLNLVEPEYSDCWHCLKETIHPVTERLDAERLTEFATVYLTNATVGNGKTDEFWLTGAINIFQAMIGLSAWKHESFILEAIRKITRDLYIASDRYADYEDLSAEEREDGMFPINKAKDRFRSIARYCGFTENKIEDIFNEINDKAPEFSIGSVFHDIIDLSGGDFKAIAEEVQMIPHEHPAWIAYKTFAGDKVSDQVKASTIQGVSLRLQLLIGRDLRKVLSNDGINFQEVNRKQTVYFVIIPDMSISMRPITSLFFAFLFKDAARTWDKVDAECKEKGINTLSVLHPVSIIMDEFYSIGMIPSFATFLSTTRSRKLNVSIILQAITQLTELYGEEGSAIIQAGCDTLVFLGCNDPVTAEHISTFIAGEATVLDTSHKDALGGLSGIKGPTEVSMSESKRYVLTVDEVRRYKDSILIARRGELPLDLIRYGYTEHELANRLEKQSIHSSIEPISTRIRKKDAFNRTDALYNTADMSEAAKAASNKALIADIQEKVKNIYWQITNDCEDEDILDLDGLEEYIPEEEREDDIPPAENAEDLPVVDVEFKEVPPDAPKSKEFNEEEFAEINKKKKKKKKSRSNRTTQMRAVNTGEKSDLEEDEDEEPIVLN